MTTAKKQQKMGSTHGAYNYMDLMTDLKLVDPEARWMVNAACKDMDGSLFFPTSGRNDVAKAARKVCATCPVTAQCLRYATVNNIAYGIWGGLSVSERKKQGILKTYG